LPQATQAHGYVFGVHGKAHRAAAISREARGTTDHHVGQVAAGYLTSRSRTEWT